MSLPERVQDAITEDNRLDSLGWYLCWWPGAKEASLDGHFTAEELEAIAAFMRAHMGDHDK